MKIGLIGAGFMGRTHADAWRECGGDVTGVLATPDRSAHALADAYGASVAESVAELARSTDVVDICSPTPLHRDHLLAAVDEGSRAIFCEKPLARHLTDAEAMVRSCRDGGVTLGVGHVLRFFPEYVSALAAARRGELGELAVLRFSRRTFAPHKAWFLDTAQSGGVVLDLMIHDLDFARLAAGEVQRVYARLDSGSDGRQHAYALLTHASGTLTHVEGSWRYPRPEFHTSFEFAGSKALVTFDSQSAGAIRSHLAPSEGTGAHGDRTLPEVPVAASPVTENPYAAQLAAFRHAIETGSQPPVSGEEGLRTLRLALAVLESSELGRPVEITPWEGAR